MLKKCLTVAMVISVAGCGVKNYREEFASHTELVPKLSVVRQMLLGIKVPHNPDDIYQQLLDSRTPEKNANGVVIKKDVLGIVAAIALGNIYYEIGDKKIHREVVRVVWRNDDFEKGKFETFFEDRDIKTDGLIRRFKSGIYKWGTTEASYQNLLP